MKAATIEVKQHVKRTTQASKQQYKNVKVVKGWLGIQGQEPQRMPMRVQTLKNVTHVMLGQ